MKEEVIQLLSSTVEGLTYKEMSVALGKPEPSVRRTVGALMNWLERHDNPPAKVVTGERGGHRTYRVIQLHGPVIEIEAYVKDDDRAKSVRPGVMCSRCDNNPCQLMDTRCPEYKEDAKCAACADTGTQYEDGGKPVPCYECHPQKFAPPGVQLGDTTPAPSLGFEEEAKSRGFEAAAAQDIDHGSGPVN
jgi:hypothetical protein